MPSLEAHVPSLLVPIQTHKMRLGFPISDSFSPISFISKFISGHRVLRAPPWLHGRLPGGCVHGPPSDFP
jgi:hypothetical protein